MKVDYELPSETLQRFETGDIESVLLGARGYFLFDRDSPGHNQVLGLQYLLIWSSHGNKVMASRAFVGLMHVLADSGLLRDLMNLLDAYYVFVVQLGSFEELDIEWNELAFIVRNCYARYSPNFVNDPVTLMSIGSVERLFCKMGQ